MASKVRMALRALGFQSARPLHQEPPQSLGALFSFSLRRHLVRINVVGDGHCGAYVLAILNFAMQRKVSPQTQIRRSIYQLACAQTRGRLPPALWDEFARTFRRIAKDAYLNDTEMVLFLQAQRLNVHVLTLAKELVVQSFVVNDPIGHVFLIFSLGCHWEILARATQRTPGGFSPIWTLRSGNALLMHLRDMRAVMREGATPVATYTTILNEVPLFRIDADDRLWV